MRGALLALVCLLAACTSRYDWSKEGATTAELNHDIGWCQAEADMAVNYLDDRERYRASIVELETFNACMEKRGYRQPQ